jgi:zinc/manganese transport system substrate-binding protein
MRTILVFVYRGPMTSRRAFAVLAAAAAALALALALWATSRAASTTGGSTIQVVAAENVWGSIAAQLGGSRAHVTSIVTNPATDPHDYEPTAIDARALAGAKLVIDNGVGYDPWVQKLLAANPVQGRVVLTVGDLVGVKAGGNPHRWYSPANVQQVIAAITRAYEQLDPGDRASFQHRQRRFERVGLAAYENEIASIRRRFAGLKVGASESIFAMLAPALHLDLVTPPTFLTSISEGTEPTAKDLTTIGRQISRREIKVWVYNSQNGTPDVQRLTGAARKHGIPVTTITETPVPANATFQAWQVAQLRSLARALATATGR